MFFRKKNNHNNYDPPPDIDHSKPSKEVTSERFDYFVNYAWDEIPSNIKKQLKNVAIVVEDSHPTRNLLGLFEGIPLPKQTHNQGGKLPAKITLYKTPLQNSTVNEKQLYEQVRKTLFHEIGHFFGLDHDVLDKYGY